MNGLGNLFKNRSDIYLVGILLLSLLLYSRILWNDFAVDDFPAIVDNSLVQKGVSGIPELISESFYYGYDQRAEANEYRPLASSFYALERSLFGKSNATLYHASSLLLYLLVLISVFFLVKDLSDKTTALWTTLVFALLPVHSEVVANIKAQDDLLMALFLLLSLWFWVNKSRAGYSLLSVICFLLALFSKEAALPLILLFPAIDYLRHKRLDKRALWFLVPSAFYLFIRFLVLEGVQEVEVVNNALAFASGYGEQTAMGFAFFLHYIKMLVYPYTLSWDYSFNHFALHGWKHWQSITGLLLFLGLILFALRGLRKPDLYSWLIFFFLLSLFLYLQILFLLEATFAERFLFIPSFAFAFLLALLLQKKSFFKWLVGCVLILWCAVIWMRSSDWKNNLTLFQADIEKVPESIRANSALAYSLYTKAISGEEADMPLLEQSAEYYRKAINIYGNDASTWYNFGMCNLAMGDYTMAELCFTDCLRLKPKHSAAFNNLGNIEYLKGEHGRAKNYYLQAILADKDNGEAWSNAGAEYLLFKQNDSAFYALQKAVKLEPANENAKYNLNVAKKRLGYPE